MPPPVAPVRLSTWAGAASPHTNSIARAAALSVGTSRGQRSARAAGQTGAAGLVPHRALAERVAALLVPQPERRYGEQPAARVPARRDALGRPCYRHATPPAPPRRLELVIDCSGSMDGAPIEDARHLAVTLSLPAEQGRLTGGVTLSAVLNECLNRRLPLPRSALERIVAPAEDGGLNAAVLAHAHILAQADCVFVSTDGAITDEPIARATKRACGLHVLGMRTGTPARATQMAQHFERYLVRVSLERTLEAMLHLPVGR